VASRSAGRRRCLKRRRQPREATKPLYDRLDRERWATLEVKLGKQWMTWVGAIVLFLSAVSLSSMRSSTNGWARARVILGVVAGMACSRGRRTAANAGTGQGLVGAGLACCMFRYSPAMVCWAAPTSRHFHSPVIVTAGGVVLAVIHDAVAVVSLPFWAAC
jgi:hypothetical protein